MSQSKRATTESLPESKRQRAVSAVPRNVSLAVWPLEVVVPVLACMTPAERRLAAQISRRWWHALVVLHGGELHVANVDHPWRTPLASNIVQGLTLRYDDVAVAITRMLQAVDGVTALRTVRALCINDGDILAELAAALPTCVRRLHIEACAGEAPRLADALERLRGVQIVVGNCAELVLSRPVVVAACDSADTKWHNANFVRATGGNY